MFKKITQLPSFSQVFVGTLLAVLTAVANGAGNPDNGDPYKGDSYNAAANYKNEMAACKNESPKSRRAACIAEANKTLSDYRRGTKSYQQTLQSNASQRCQALKSDNRSACESRMRGEGNTDGSVAEGGILRETVTIVPVK